jgi:hypothetical protein
MVANLRARGCKVCKVASGADLGNKRTVAILLSLGLEPGVADYFVIVPGGHTIYLEMKPRKGGSLNADQRTWHREARELGAPVVTGHGAEHACAEVERVALERWGVTLAPIELVAPSGQNKGS